MSHWYSQVFSREGYIAEHSSIPSPATNSAYRDFSPRPSRLAWLADISHLLTKNSIGWTMWDYAGSFATATGHPGHRAPDTEVVKALGLA